jgi:hypothetical protein
MTKDKTRITTGAAVEASSTVSTAAITLDGKIATTSTATVNSRTSYFSRLLTPELPQFDPHTVQVVWRDCFFILLGCVAISIIGYVETHAMDADARMTVHIAGLFHTHDMPTNPHGIVDTGFILTYPFYEFLKENRDWCDIFAGLNSLVLIFPAIYVTYITVWKGDYSCVFRVLAVQLLRAFCGWFTYLPPDPTYLNSYYDFPDFVHCLFQECKAGDAPEVMPFVSFFSGHCATMVVVGNHMALSNSTRSWAILVHILNVLQVVRLLATRGHYSIDMIIGWYVAVYVSAPAGRLGRYYSQGANVQDILPKTPLEAFDYATGVADTRLQRRMSLLMQRPEVQEALEAMQKEDGEEDVAIQSETTATILQETASKMMQEQAELLQEEIQHLQQQARQAVEAMKEKRLKMSASKKDCVAKENSSTPVQKKVQ